jgi:formate dehydrogenase iron-sulfur subunit
MTDDSKTFAILTDTTRCTGCQTCVAACKEANHLSKDQPRRWKREIDSLSATRFTTIVAKPGGHYVRQLCRHCKEPACVSACIVGALQKTPEGPVIYDGDKCMGCRYCMMACPYGIPRYEWADAVPYIRKCIMCYTRLKDGGQPACTEACPEKATIFGTRAEMLALARDRIAKNPGKYVNKVFGEHEVGGTSVLYISDIPLGFLGWQPNLGDEPLPKLTWAALKKVPPVVIGVAGAMTGVYWIIGRRMRLQTLSAEQAASLACEAGSADEAGPSSDAAQPSQDAASENAEK